jgi:glutathione synthase/RimK-type ligase-like ATP-grasp enzyme
MRKIGILHGRESTFPPALIERIARKRPDGISAELVRIDKLLQGEPSDYAVILDRISQDVPFYRAFLKNAALNGTAVVNNPFWWSADEKFFNNCLATKVGVAVPKTVLLPSYENPPDTTAESFRNLAWPLDWPAIFEYIGFPAYFKPHSGGGWKNVYKVNDAEDFFAKYHETGQLVMLLQEEIQFDEYFRCYVLDRRDVLVMPYEPRHPHHLRYVVDRPPSDPRLLERVREDALKLNHALGYDFNTVEFAVRDGVPYAIDFCNPAPDAEASSVGDDNFAWIVEAAANMAIRKAQAYVEGRNNLRWGEFMRSAVAPPAAAR